MRGADSGLRHALIDSNLLTSRAARIFIGQLAEQQVNPYFDIDQLLRERMQILCKYCGGEPSIML